MSPLFGFSENERITVLPPFPYAVLLLSVILSAAYLGSGLCLPLAIISSSLSALIGIAFAKSAMGTLVTVLPLGFVWIYTGSFTASALISAIITVLGVTCFIYKVTRSPLILAAIPLSYLIAYSASGSFLTALLSLAIFPAAAVMALSASGKRPRMSLICRTSVALFVTVIASVAVWLALSGKGLSFSDIASSADSLFYKLRDYFVTQYAEMSLKYAELGLDPVKEALTETDAKAYALALFCAIPATLITVINISSFCATQLTASLFASGGLKEYLTPAALSFSMSPVSVAVFLISYFMILVSPEGSFGTATIIAENIYLILLPGLSFTGVLTLLGKGIGRRKHIFILIAIAAVFLWAPSLSLAVISFIGCYTVAKSAILTVIFKTRK